MAESKNPGRSQQNLLLRAAAFSTRLLPHSITRYLYRLPLITALLRGLLNRAAPESLTVVTISSGLLSGQQMELNLKSEKDFWFGSFEPDLLNAIERFVLPGMTVFDVGANIGYITLAMAKEVGPSGNVVAFEPQPENVVRLKRTLALNGLAEQVEVVEAAVGDVEGLEPFLVHSSTSMGKLQKSKGRTIEYRATTRVPVVTLDAWIERWKGDPAAIIKIDVEGGESLVLRGSTNLLAEVRPIFLIEIHGPEAGVEVGDELLQASYHLYQMKTNGQMREIASIEDMPWKLHMLAVPDKKQAMVDRDQRISEDEV